MKDFYDIWTLIHQFQIQKKDIAPVIRKVFQNRKTLISETPKAFSELFYGTLKTKERWGSFLKGIGHHPMDLKQVILELRDFFLPILFEDKI